VTSGYHSPDSLAPLTPGFAPCALSDVPVNDHKSDRLFGEIVRRFDSRRRDKAKVACAIFPQTLGQIPRLLAGWNLMDCRSKDLLALRFQEGLELRRGELIPAMNGVEQFPQTFQKALPVVARRRVRPTWSHTS
jgi:hypothetical protein